MTLPQSGSREDLGRGLPAAVLDGEAKSQLKILSEPPDTFGYLTRPSSPPVTLGRPAKISEKIKGAKTCLRPVEQCDDGGLIILKIFAGTDELSKCFKKYGFTVIQWDILHGPGFDFAHKCSFGRLLAKIKQWIVEERLVYVHLGVPCVTFSRARCPPLRSRGELWGLPSLKEFKDLQQVCEANAVTKHALQVIEVLLIANIMMSVENPASSMLWLLPFFEPACKRGRLQKVDVDYCQFGMPYRKRTTFAVAGVFNIDSIGLKCSGHKGICSMTSKPHIVLRGKLCSGINMTKWAEPYPSKLCARIALSVWQSFQQRLCNKSQAFHIARTLVPGLVPSARGRAS